jgi:hypothetical protein
MTHWSHEVTMDKPSKPELDRRSFLTGAATGAAAGFLAQQAPLASAQQSPAEIRADVSQARDTSSDARRPASDYMVDIFKSLDIEYMFSMCAASFMGIHESVLNYAGNSKPEAIACTHEEISVAMANGPSSYVHTRRLRSTTAISTGSMKWWVADGR